MIEDLAEVNARVGRCAELVIEANGKSDDDRPLESIAPVMGANSGWGVHMSNLANSVCAVLERVFYVKNKKTGLFEPPPQPGKQAINKLARFRQLLVSRVPSTPAMTNAEFLSTYRGRKRKVYEQQVARSVTRGPPMEKDAEVKSFVKREKLKFTEAKGPVEVVPRLIQPRSPFYNLHLGKFIKPLEHAIFVAIDDLFGHPTVMKGKNAEDRGKAIEHAWKQFRHPVAVGYDAERFDQHVSTPMLEFEHSVYNMIMRDPELKRLLKMQLTTAGVVWTKEGVVRYLVSGGRCSGDMNTSLGNVLLMCAMMWTYFKMVGLRCRLIDDGDDSVIILEKGDLGKLVGLPDTFRAWGFSMAVEKPVEVLEQIVFCQSSPVLTARGYVMVRDPRTCMGKDVLNVTPVRCANELNMVRKAISECGLALAGDVPVLGEFYAYLGRDAKFRKTRQEREWTGMDYLARGCAGRYAPPSDETRFSFYQAFDILPDHQVAIEQELRTMQHGDYNPTQVAEFYRLGWYGPTI